MWRGVRRRCTAQAQDDDNGNAQAQDDDDGNAQAQDDNDGNAQAQDDDDVVVLLLLHFCGCVAVVPLLLPIS